MDMRMIDNSPRRHLFHRQNADEEHGLVGIIAED